MILFAALAAIIGDAGGYWLGRSAGKRLLELLRIKGEKLKRIGFSRLYLGMHYLSDVLAGFAAGGLWLTVCITAIELVRRGEIHFTLFDRIKA